MTVHCIPFFSITGVAKSCRLLRCPLCANLSFPFLASSILLMTFCEFIMNQRFLALSFFTLFFQVLALVASPVRGEVCVLVQSSSLKPYEDARQGFERGWRASVAHAGKKSVSVDVLSHILLSGQHGELEKEEKNQLKEQLQHAKVVVAIGDPALHAVEDLVDVPVVYLLAPSARDLPAHFTGIDLRIRPSQQLMAINRLFPQIQSLGALYNPVRNGQWVQEALSYPTGSLQTLLFRKISSASDVPGALAELGKVVDAYWLLPEELLITPQALAHLQDFSIKNQVPVLSFSDKYLKAGAAAAIIADPADMGGQAAAMALRLVSGTPVGEVGVEAPRRQKIIANTAVLRKMGLVINEQAVDEVYTGAQ